MDWSVKLGGNVFTVQPLNALDSFTLQPRLAPALSEVMGVLAKLVGEGDDAAEVDAAAIAPVVGAFFARLPPAEMRAITLQLLQGATIDGIQLFTPQGNPFDVKMRGRTLDTWMLLWHAVKCNYADFFERLGASLAAKKAASSEASTT